MELSFESDERLIMAIYPIYQSAMCSCFMNIYKLHAALAIGCYFMNVFKLPALRARLLCHEYLCVTGRHTHRAQNFQG